MSKERRNIEKLYDVIKRPIITEKSMMATALGKYTFEVQKDATKVDRSAAYMMRHIAKNIVANGFAKKCELQVAYAIGVEQPMSIFVDTFGTNAIPEEEIEEKIEKCMKNSRNPMSFVNTITAALLNGAVDEESVIDELERIVQKRKKEIL